MSDWHRLALAARRRLSRALNHEPQDDFLPNPRRDDDLFLVEFPKSGVTWLTFLVANVNALLSREQREVTFFNINDFVPEVPITRNMSERSLLAPGHRCFKSHSPYTQKYRKVFYLVRDPRHVMVSYWVFLNGLGWWDGSLEELILHPEQGIGAWKGHVAGWLDGVDATTSFALIRYEDLMADPACELRSLYQLLGFHLSDEILANAVARSSIERMRKLERQANARHPRLKNFAFVREKQVGGPRQALSDDLCSLIEREAGPIMERLGYQIGKAGINPALKRPFENV